VNNHLMLIKQGFITGLLTVSLTACDAPRTTRTLPSKSATYVSPSSFTGFNTGNTTSQGSGTQGSSSGSGTGSSGAGSGSGTGSASNSIPADAAHCSWSADGISGYQYTHNHIGVFSFCRSSSNNMRVYIQVKMPISDSNLCVIPTTSVSTNSTYIGGPRCVFANDPLKIYPIDLSKNRAGYSDYSMTGSMIMKDKMYYYPPPFNQNLLSPDAYLYCSQWLAQTGDSSYCSAFVSVGQYIYHKF
jgi:hypothetical protein